MRELWRRFGQPGVGLPEGGFERLAEDVSGHDTKVGEALQDLNVLATYMDRLHCVI